MELTSRENELIRATDTENKQRLESLREFKERNIEALFRILDQIRMINNEAYDIAKIYKNISTKDIENYIGFLDETEKTLIKQTNCKHTKVEWESDGYFNCTEEYRLICGDCQLIFAYK